MLIALWIVNALLALAFGAAGAMKLLKPKADIVAGGMGWAENFHPVAIKLIGAAELLGVVGLIVPLATGIAPILTPIAATALAVVMVSAIVVHTRRKESFMPSFVLGVVAAASAVLGYLVVLG